MSELKVIKLTQPGYENFTGQMGQIDFTDGQSDYGVSPQRAAAFLINVTGEYIEPAAPEAPEPETTK